jgi:mono/diheme cytochrome c family protein
MNDTVFYVVGIVLVVAALVVSAVGLRFKDFPASTPLLMGVVAVFVVLVGGTTVFAWRNAEDEEAHREAEHIEPPAVEPSGEVVEQENTPADTATGSPATATTTGQTTTETGATTGETTTAASTAEGAQLFESQGCTGCHTLAAAGSTGTTGPVLDSALKGESKQFINTSIVDPNADIAKGFQPNVMPQTYGQQLTPEQLNALVEYLYQSVNAKG